MLVYCVYTPEQIQLVFDVSVTTEHSYCELDLAGSSDQPAEKETYRADGCCTFSAGAVFAVTACPSVCLSLRPFVTSQSSINKTAKLKATPHYSPGTAVLRCRRSLRNSDGITPSGGAKCRWGRCKNCVFRPVEKSTSQTPYRRQFASIPCSITSR